MLFFSRRRPRVARPSTGGAVALALVATLVVPLNQAGAATGYVPLQPQHEKPVPAANVPARTTKGANPAAEKAVKNPTATAWPAPGSGTIPVGVQGKAAVRVGEVPVAVTGKGASKVKVDVLDTAGTAWAGKPAVLLRLTRADGGTDPGDVAVNLNYEAFRNAGGADFGSRLRFVELPDCAVTTPEAANCAGTSVDSTNKGDGWVGATVSAAPDKAPGGLYALAAGAGGSSGSYGATSLSPSSSWEAGGSSGDFTWSYPLRSPPSTGGPAPSLSLSYSAQSVDGKTAATNNQPSWIGEGFEMWSGYVERNYRPCSDDMDGPGANNKDHKTGDLCWATDNATMSLNGTTVELIRDASGAWHPRQDDGSKVEHLDSSANDGAANEDNNHEHWKVTTPNGTVYWFGLNHLPGWAAGKPATNSTWTVPVHGNNPGEPCNLATFAASYCAQAWRWNLDYVQDPHDNSMSYWYSTETSHYGMNLTPTDVKEYVRGGTLTSIHYGTTAGTNFASPPPMRVDFGSADRCLPDKACDITKKENWPNWPDVPWDQYCASTTSCDQTSPTFFTQKRLATVTTKVLDRSVDQWTLKHTYPDPGDGTRAGLWLDAIGHSGLDVPAGQPPTTVPDVTFQGTQRANRVDTNTDNRPAMNWWRVSNIYTETGGHFGIAYSQPECKAGTHMPSSPDTNQMRCYPVKWTPDGYTDPITDWFNKYVVEGVTEADDVGGSRIKETHYTYLNGAAWHYVDDNGIITKKDMTWSVWRGYGSVRVTEGVGDEQTSGVTTYFRGMDGDKTNSGTRRVDVPDSQGGKVPDSDAFAGTPREVISSNGDAEVSGTITDMWASAPTSTRTINGDTVVARYTAPSAVHKRTDLDGGRGLLRNTVTKTYDQYGMVTKVDDTGDESKTGDEKCTTTTYTRNTAKWLMSYISRAQSVALPCGQNPTTPTQVLGDGRTYYDAQAFGVAPTKGDVTQTESLKDWTAGTYIVNTKSAYDTLGRVTDSWDVRGNRSTTVYTPATGPLTRTVSTNQLGWTSTVDYNPGSGAMVDQIDPNNRRTDLAYDGLGRLVAVWAPGRDRTQEPSTKYSYTVRTNGVNTVTSSSINSNAGYITTYTIYDGLLRPRQTQAASNGGGRLVTDTFYDSAGRVSVENGVYAATGEPGPDLAAYTDQNQIPAQSRTTYDAAGRPVTNVVTSLGKELRRTTTAYGGDHTDVTPPAGTTPTSTYTDIYDRTTEIRQYHGTTPTGAYDSTKYTYNDRNQPVTVTAPDNTVRTFGYDFLGRQTTLKDPDRGLTSTEYNDYGDTVSTTDARNHRLAFTYDQLGRRTAEYDGSTAGPKLADWTYDTLEKGQAADTTRYADGNAYKTAVTGYDAEYRPKGTTVTIPASSGALAGTYTFNNTYTADGKPATTTFPAAGGLPVETVKYAYDNLGLPTTLTSNVSSYVTKTQYTDRGEPAVYSLQTSPSQWRTEIGLQYDTATRSLTNALFTRESTSPNNTISDTHYSRDPSGNITKIVQTPVKDGDPAAATADTQCFSYDYVQRLTDAWTPRTGDCAGGPKDLGGVSPYWQSFTYALSGNRLTKTDHATTGDTTTTYNYPTNGVQPHTITSATATSPSGLVTTGYAYDANGSMVSHASGQQLTWDAEGNLATATDSGRTSSYVYNTDGTPLISREPSGTTLFLPGLELRLDAKTNTVSGTRFYTDAAGTTLAQRTPTGVTWLMPDPQGTTNTTVATDPAQTVSQRWQLPFGDPRGVKPSSWANRHGFVNGQVQETGLEQVGAREYDAGMGSFISADAVLDTSDPQQLQGYAYANSSPITNSDPSGNMLQHEGGDGSSCGNACHMQNPYSPGNSGSGHGGGGHKRPPSTNSSHSHHSDDDGGFWGSLWNTAVNFVDEHKAVIAGVVTEIVVGAVCEAATAGAGSIGCAALAGAAGSAVSYTIETAVEHKGSFSWGGLGMASLSGAVSGALTGGIGAVFAGAGVRAVASEVATSGLSAGARAATATVRGALTTAEHTAAGAGIRTAAKEAAGVAGKEAGSVGKTAKSALGCNSFTADTPVLMADGTTKPISGVQVGARVQATDPATGTTTVEPVTAVIVGRGTKHLVDITVDGPQPATITATDGHPIWVEGRGWVDAGEIRAGDLVRGPAGTGTVAVTSVHDRGEVQYQTVYNLTIGDVHTYHVRAGDKNILVHNSSCPKAGDPGHVCTSSCRRGGSEENEVDHSTVEGETSAAEGKARREAGVNAYKTVQDKHVDGDPLGALVVGAAAIIAGIRHVWRNRPWLRR